MANEKMFEIALKEKFRFPFRGNLSVEDLWDLYPEDLDTIFKTLNAQKKSTNEESLLETSYENTELNLKIEIVKYIVSVKLNERKEREDARAKKEQKQKIMAIIDVKKEESLHNMSVDELTEMLNKLEE